MIKLTKPILYGILIFQLIPTFGLADEIWIDGTDTNGWDTSEYREVDDTNIVDGFVKDLKGNIIFLEDKSQNAVEEDAFGQIPEFEDDVDFFGQNYEINLEEE